MATICRDLTDAKQICRNIDNNHRICREQIKFCSETDPNSESLSDKRHNKLNEPIVETRKGAVRGRTLLEAGFNRPVFSFRVDFKRTIYNSKHNN